MKVTETHLKGCFIIEPLVFHDERGLFFESFQKEKLEKALGLTLNFVQHNQSVSKQGVLRGLHYQKGEHAQAKLVQVIKGEVLDVIVDLRKESATFGQHITFQLADHIKKLIFIPRGMAHGFLVHSKEAIFSYQCDNYYNKDSEAGILFNDKDLAIAWNCDLDKIILSDKDRALPTFKMLYP